MGVCMECLVNIILAVLSMAGAIGSNAHVMSIVSWNVLSRERCLPLTEYIGC